MSIEDLLKMPKDAEQWPTAWRNLIGCGTLFPALQKLVQSDGRDGSIELLNAAEKLIAKWSEFLPYGKKKFPKIEEQWITIRSLVWCAQEAAKKREFYRNDVGSINRLSLKTSETPDYIPDYIKEDEPWVWICIRTLLGVPCHKVEVPVALWDERKKDDDSGLIVTLILERLDNGVGKIIHHPQYADFCTTADKDFLSAMDDAWEAARNLLQEKGNDVGQFDGRWHLLNNGLPITEVKGRSAAGAASQGWFFALQNKYPPQGVIVLSDIDRKGKVKEVDGILAKVRAVIKCSRLDTIVLADKNRAEAELALVGNSQIRLR
jgi:hypothetical protein